MTIARRLFLALMLLWPLAAAGQQAAIVSYEVAPSADAEQAIASADLFARNMARQGYAAAAGFADSIRAELVAEIVRAVGLNARDAETRFAPGGYLLATNPSLQTEAAFAAPDMVRLAAALGFVFGQDGVLLWRLDDPDGRTGYGAVAFAPGTLDAAMARRFFAHAGAVAKGLGGGYSVRGDEMIFLNLRDNSGKLLSGLGDEAFIAALGRAARSFPGETATLARAGTAYARLLINDWTEHRIGEAYAAWLPRAALARLSALRLRFADMIKTQMHIQGWQ